MSASARTEVVDTARKPHQRTDEKSVAEREGKGVKAKIKISI